MPLCQIISLIARVPLFQMARKKLNILFIKKEVFQFQVAFVQYLYLKQNKVFKKKFYK